MLSKNLQTLLIEHFTQSQLDEYEISYHDYLTNKNSTRAIVSTNDSNDISFVNTISSHVTSISNILIPIYKQDKIQNTSIVEVESTKTNLRKIALAIAANKAICLNGPVGSGKTALIEYIVAKTGRVLGETFIKVQLGDQTDSKMLLGTYRCTDIPGEFIWQPGVLTQVKKSHPTV